MRVDEQDKVVSTDPRTGKQFDLSTYDPMTDLWIRHRILDIMNPS